MRVRVRSWHGVASWLWVANDENCGICRMAFNGCCPDCECGSGTDTGHCARGGADGVFVPQQVQQHCPMCRQEWKFRE
ncbi:anaphase-promoting complex subunit 11 isoform X2 [Lonchura striata]|uniref:anaphase-promoting complex subunit 11 isoform X2 n=1 Tax=Lonchura striata TaxID=40157 RepID=UPI000B4CF63F|nr:anaphase-promoting complex subunit 11 isoform X2 [Lonchura striata domestica]